MVANKTALLRAYDAGHAWSDPDKPVQVTREEIVRNSASVTSDREQEIIRSFQDFNSVDLERGCLKKHKRPPRVDGLAGEVTDRIAFVRETKGCWYPDHVPPPGTSFAGFNEEDQQRLQQWQNNMAVVGSGSYPEPCQKAGVKVHVDLKNANSRTRKIMSNVLKRVFLAYAMIGLKLVLVDNAEEAHIRISFRHGSRWIGLAQFSNGTCSGWVFHYLDINYCESAHEDQVARLVCHELGHNVRLNHTRQVAQNVMSPVIGRGFNGWQENDASYPTLVDFFGGVPIKGWDGDDTEGKIFLDLYEKSENDGVFTWRPKRVQVVTNGGGGNGGGGNGGGDDDFFNDWG